jgi:hypothetical protein
MGSFKKLKSSDVITTPVIANKQWNFNYSPLPLNDPYIGFYNGTNIPGIFNPEGEPITNGQYDRLMYDFINQLFYHQYSGSLSTASLASSIYYESASGLRPTQSYFNFNNDPGFINTFPTGVSDSIKILSISPSVFGEQVLPYTFQLSSSAFVITDDGKGNLYSGQTQVGNIFYPEGIVVITNANLQNEFPLPPVAYNDVINIIRSDYGDPVVLNLSPLTNDDLRGNTLINQSIQLFGGQVSYFATGSNNTVTMSFSGLGVGVYQTFYTFQVTGSYGSPLTSNTGSIIITVQDPECSFELSVTQYEELILATANVNGDEICVIFETFAGPLG